MTFEPLERFHLRCFQVNDILKALQTLERVVDGRHPTGGKLAGCITREIHQCPPCQFVTGNIPGTSEVNPKLRLPVESLVRYLQERLGLNQEGTKFTPEL